MSINRREMIFGAAAVLVVAPSIGGYFRKLFTGSRLKKMTWYRIWEAWDANGNPVPVLAEGNSSPVNKGLTLIRPVYVFRTNRRGEVAQVLRRSQIPLHPVTYESQHWSQPRPSKSFMWYNSYEPYDPTKTEFYGGATPAEIALHRFVSKLVA